MKKITVLTEDFWHHRGEIEPLIKAAFSEDGYSARVSESPEEILNAMKDTDLFISFKDPIENDQVPTPVWWDDSFTDAFFERLKNGMGFLCCHAALTDLPREHRLISELTGSVFISHPEQCPMSMKFQGEHAITRGMKDFSFPVPDEHYIMEMLQGYECEELCVTESEHGCQPALWVKEYGEGRACMTTIGHNTENLICPEYLALFKNAANWCLKML